ncbi:MAG: hypothetical protein ACE366_00380 [Bradymonadia bacterium]
MSFRRRIASVVCATAATIVAGQASAQFFIAEPTGVFYEPTVLCAPPTLADCLSPAYLETSCGVEATRRQSAYPDGTPSCTEQLAEHGFSNAHTLPQVLALSPEGEVEVVAETPYSHEGMTYVREGADTYGDIVAQTHTQTTAFGGFTEDVLQKRRDYRANDAGFETCEEYIYEKYYDVSRFEDAIAPLGTEYTTMVEVAREGIAAAHMGLDPSDPGPELRGFDGTPIEQGEVQMVPRNAYFGAPIDLIAGDDRLSHLTGLFEDPEVSTRPDTLAWQMQAARQLSDTLDEVMLQHDMPQRAFSYAVERRADLVARIDLLSTADPIGDCYGEIDEETGFCNGESLDAEEAGAALEVAQVELEVVNEQIVEGLLVAEAEGCLSAREITPCDYSPRRLVEAIADKVNDKREADYAACRALQKEAEHSVLTNLNGVPLLDLDGNVVAEGRLWLASPRSFDLFRVLKELNDNARKAEAERRQAEQRAQEEKARAAAKAAMSKVGGGLKDPAQKFSKFSKLGNNDFNLYYEYLMRWRVFDFERILCNVNAEFEAMFRAGATGFGKQVNLIYVRFFANMHKYEGDVQIAGKSLYKGRKNLVGALTFDLVKDQKIETPKMEVKGSMWFTVVFIPVKVEGGISGKLGLSFGAKAGVDKGGAQCTHVAAYVKGQVKPYAMLNGFAALSIDILIARAGIKGTLEFLNMSLPFKAKIALNAPRGDIRALELVVETGLDFAFRALSGKIALWGEAGWCPFCVKGQVTIFKWTGPKWNTNIFKTKLKVPLFGLQSLAANP